MQPEVCEQVTANTGSQALHALKECARWYLHRYMSESSKHNVTASDGTAPVSFLLNFDCSLQCRASQYITLTSTRPPFPCGTSVTTRLPWGAHGLWVWCAVLQSRISERVMRCWDPTKYNIYIRYIYPIRLNYDRTFLSGVPDCALIAIASLSLDRAG